MVLILVLMEDGLWLHHSHDAGHLPVLVLILVLMEDGLWQQRRSIYNTGNRVLILVLMEDGLWRQSVLILYKIAKSLNPCFNGRWSLTISFVRDDNGEYSLNPCFNGRWSLTTNHNLRTRKTVYVLILVLQEDGLWLIKVDLYKDSVYGLNPCFNGRWSLTLRTQ